MDNAKIIKLSELDASYLEQASALLVDSFYFMFQRISKDKKILRKLFTPCIQAELFHVVLQNNHIAGLIAISDSTKRAVIINETVCISIFGKVKGKLLAWQVSQIFNIPEVTDQTDGYIDFLATTPNDRRKGIAEHLLTFAESNAIFANLYLDVLVDNIPAIKLYQKLGYKSQGVKKGFLMNLAGIKTMYCMKKNLR